MFAAKAKAYLAMKFLGPTLNWTFKNLLPANDQVLLDQNKPKELAMLKSKEMNLHVMNIMTVMLSESDLMLMMVESSKSQDWPDGLAYVLWEKLLRKFNSLTAIGGHDHQYFNKLRSTVVSRRIFIRSQSLIAR
jgi:hypothetical protein